MTPELESTQLFKWLQRRNTQLASRVVHVRTEVAKWLLHVVQLFPHYPSHGADHSDRIVAQLSKLLFSKTKPVVEFSAGEVYCLLCAAYLHDMGMVVSPGDVAAMLVSENWNAFVASDGEGHEAYQKYLASRTAPIQGNKELSEFLGDLALRQLIAEFVRPWSPRAG